MQTSSATSLDLSSELPAERSRYVWMIAASAALGGLLFGYDWVVIGGAREFYEVYFHLASPTLIGWVNSCALVGCLLGSLAAGGLARRFGRRPVLILSALLFASSSVLTGWAQSIQAFIFWRITGGIAIGFASNVSPLYIAEISPASIRGRLVSLNQFAIVIGILLSQVVNWMIARPVSPGGTGADTWNVQYGWRWMFTAIVLPSAVFTVASAFLPESPRWLAARSRYKEAEGVLAKIGGRLMRELSSPAYAQEQLLRIRSCGVVRCVACPDSSACPDRYRACGPAAMDGDQHAFQLRLGGLSTRRVRHRWHFAEHRCHGSDQRSLHCSSYAAGGPSWTTCTDVVWLPRHRRASHLLCALAYRQHWKAAYVLVLTLSAIACYALTLAPLTWVLIAEMFPQRVRSQAVSVAVSALWVASFVLTYTFPLLNRVLGTSSIFGLYGTTCLLGFFLVFFLVPETNGGSLEELERRLSQA